MHESWGGGPRECTCGMHALPVWEKSTWQQALRAHTPQDQHPTNAVYRPVTHLSPGPRAPSTLALCSLPLAQTQLHTKRLQKSPT